MSIGFLLLLVGANTDQLRSVDIWAGKVEGISLDLVAQRYHFEGNNDPQVPEWARTYVTVFSLNARSSRGERAKCIWRRAARTSLTDASVHEGRNGVLGIAHFTRSTTGRVHSVVIEEVSVANNFDNPPPDCSKEVTAVFPTEKVSFNPLQVLSASFNGVPNELHGYLPTLQRLIPRGETWMLTMCLNGTVFEFERDDSGWKARKGVSDECSHVPALRESSKPKVLRLPSPDGIPGSSFGGFGGGGFGTRKDLEIPKAPQ